MESPATIENPSYRLDDARCRVLLQSTGGTHLPEPNRLVRLDRGGRIKATQLPLLRHQ